MKTSVMACFLIAVLSVVGCSNTGKAPARVAQKICLTRDGGTGYVSAAGVCISNHDVTAGPIIPGLNDKAAPRLPSASSR